MREISPGLLHWSTRHPAIGVEVSSYFLSGPRVAIDPLLPEGEGPEWLGHHVEHVVVTICLHTRSTTAFGLPIRAPRPGLHRWEGRDLDVEPYDDGEEVARGVRAHALGAIAADDFVLHIDAGPGALSFADGIVNYEEIRFVPDHLMGDDPDGVKRTTFERLEPLLELEFDAVLFAHGEPIASGGKQALRDFVAAGPEPWMSP